MTCTLSLKPGAQPVHNVLITSVSISEAYCQTSDEVGIILLLSKIIFEFSDHADATAAAVRLRLMRHSNEYPL